MSGNFPVKSGKQKHDLITVDSAFLEWRSVHRATFPTRLDKKL